MTKNKLWLIVPVFTSLLLINNSHAQSRRGFPGPAPGSFQVRLSEDNLILQNNLISYAWSTFGKQLKPQYVTNRLTQRTIQMQNSKCFLLVLADGQILKDSDLKIVGGVNINNLQPNSKSCRLAEKLDGMQISITLDSPDKKIRVKWRSILRNHTNYVRHELTLSATNKPVAIEKIILLEFNEPNAKVMGTVDGSPAIIDNFFFAYEHPLSKIQKLQNNPDVLQFTLPYNILLKPNEPVVYSSVIGVVPKGQLRRGFLYYVEMERAHPYRPFLHYNSWYDIGYGPEKILENEFLDVIELFADKLISQRDVIMSSFVLDDGWDDPASLWHFHSGFPDGLSNLQKAAEKYDSKIGAWLSPFGGYGKAKEQRLKYGREQGFETNKSGFSLEGPIYYKRFRDVCINMLRDYDLSYFKFDGIGVGGRPTGTTDEFAQDMNALLRLISDLRSVKPDVFINITTGTWSSPFWLWYGDSIWRSGHDWGTHGWGSKRQQQITYRDKETYHNVVLRAPLHPLNSLMTQGFMFANHGLPDDRDNITDDIRTFFASGTDCQELYVTPSLMTEQDWDALAESAKWSRINADVLIDTHWIGGDPAKGQIYGWASWSKRKGILSLRNPHEKPGSITLDIGKAFELPRGAATRYSLKSPWKQDVDKPAINLTASQKHTFELKPFQVLVFDAIPL
jgi:hypothetical protein